MSILNKAQYQTYIESSNSMSDTYFSMIVYEADKAVEAKLGSVYYTELLAAIAGGYTTALEDQLINLARPFMSWYLLNYQMQAPKVAPTQMGAKSLSSPSVEVNFDQLGIYQSQVFGMLTQRENDLNAFIKNNATTLSSDIDVNNCFLKFVSPMDQFGTNPKNYGFQIG